jgi:hypothetical protein
VFISAQNTEYWKKEQSKSKKSYVMTGRGWLTWESKAWWCNHSSCLPTYPQLRHWEDAQLASAYPRHAASTSYPSVSVARPEPWSDSVPASSHPCYFFLFRPFGFFSYNGTSICSRAVLLSVLGLKIFRTSAVWVSVKAAAGCVSWELNKRLVLFSVS